MGSAIVVEGDCVSPSTRASGLWKSLPTLMHSQERVVNSLGT